MRQPISRNHDWLSLVTASGLVVSEPVLASVFPDGPEHVELTTHRNFIREWERYQQGLSQQREDAQSRWLRFVFEELLGLTSEHWLRPPNLPETATCQLMDYEQVLRPSWVLTGPTGEHELLLSIVPPTQGLDRKEDQSGKWRASPAVKLERLLRETKVQLGLLTNGREFRLILAPAGLSASHISFEAGTWADEKSTLDGFFTLLRQDRFFGPESKRLSKLISESQEKQLEVTDQLGDQVRAALEDFVRGLDQADRQAAGELLKGLESDKLYEMSLIVMMRLVFMLYGEENYLLPHGEVLYDQAYGVTHLYTQLAGQRQRAPESMAQTFDAWPRLLATFRLIHEGCTHPDLNLIAYGGKLFNPERFPVLEDRRLRVSNGVIYAILRRLCFARAKLGRETVPQRLSYQSLDIEQIGTVYEGLIDYTVKRAPEDETLVIFKGKDQALRPLSEVGERLADIGYLQEQTGFSASRVQKLLAQQELDGEATEDLPADLLPYVGFFEGAIPPNHLYVAHQSGLRKGQGTYYTPKWITSFICERTLEPLVYEGEGEGRRLKAPDEILALKVCDPAMGSGAFLVQACRYLADRLVDSWDRLAVEQPEQILTMPYGKVLNGGPREMALPESHDEAVMWARRFVAEHCLYGVDLNPLAVELAKMSLWLITLSKDKPFEFFDHKLKHGNSLIGCWTSDLERYPASAWDRKGAEGAVKDALKQIKKDAKMQADRQAKDRAKGIVPLIGVDVAALRAETAAEMREIDEVSTFDPQQKERLYRRNIEQDERYQALKRMFDTWCALWFWPVQGGEMSADLPLAFAYPELLGHYVGAERMMADPERLERWAETVGKLWEQEHFFHWELEFPEVFEEGRGGFDAVVMNPPWERIKLQRNEFFAMRDPLIAHAPNAAARNRLVEQLPQTNPALWQEFGRDKQRAELASFFVRESKHFPLTGCGDVNLYPVFTERARWLISPLGRVGMVIPSGIATDDTTKFFFQDIMDTHSLRALYDFENREGAFPAVDSRMKFSLTLLQGAGHGASEAEFAFFLTNRGHLDDPARRFALSGEDIALLNPNTRTCPIFRTVRDAEVTKAVHRRLPHVLDEDDPERGDPWGIVIRQGLYHMTNDAAAGVLATSLPVDGSIALEGLYEGKMMGAYDHRAASVSLDLSNIHRPGQPVEGPEGHHRDPYSVVTPQFWVPVAETQRRVPVRWPHQWAVVYRNVTSATNARTLIASIVPTLSVVYSLRMVWLTKWAPLQHALFLANLNSFALDYIARQSLAGVNFSDYIMKQMPMPTPSAYSSSQASFVSSRVLELTYTAWDIQAFAEDMGYAGPPFVWDEERRAQLRAQLDALYFHLYGLTREDAEYILSTFPIVRRKDEARHGTYRTRDLILCYYDAYAKGEMEAWFGGEEEREARVHSQQRLRETER